MAPDLDPHQQAEEIEALAKEALDNLDSDGMRRLIKELDELRRDPERFRAVLADLDKHHGPASWRNVFGSPISGFPDVRVVQGDDGAYLSFSPSAYDFEVAGIMVNGFTLKVANPGEPAPPRPAPSRQIVTGKMEIRPAGRQ